MFSEEVLQKILFDPDVRMVPVCYQSVIIHAVERILEEEQKGKEENATVLKPELL